ncbi:MAG: YeeE/YedE family protein [Methylococcales bacterium]|nr:YeeE/YedE family protein [Methylococcales bacterium]
MKHLLSSLIAGTVFGVGLALSGMLDPNKVLNFLDFSGHWDPSLALVMAGALVVSFIAFRVIPKRVTPVFEDTFRLPTRSDISIRLCVGSAIFGIGWGLVGYCPGPAISVLGIGSGDIFIFTASMLAGFLIYHFTMEKKGS